MPQTVIHVFRTGGGIVPLQDWLDELEVREPRAYRKCIERILLLSQLGSELRRPMTDMLRDGIRELRVRVGAVNYRILYFFSGKDEVCLSHGVTKEAAVPDSEIETAIKRRLAVAREPASHIANWELP